MPEAGGRNPPQASSPPTRADGRRSRRADRRSGRTARGGNESSSEGAGPWPEQTDGPPSKRLPPRSGRTRRGGADRGRVGPNRARSPRFAGRRTIPGREQRSAGRGAMTSNGFSARAIRFLAGATGSRPSNQFFPSVHSSRARGPIRVTSPSSTFQRTRSFHSSITLHRCTALASAPPIGGRVRASSSSTRCSARVTRIVPRASLRDLDLACKVWHT